MNTNFWAGVKETLPYLPWLLLATGFIGWFLFMPIPALFKLQNAAFQDVNLPFILIALAILGAGHLALLDKRWINFSVFLVVPFMIFGWY